MLILPVPGTLTAAYLVPSSMDGTAASELIVRDLPRHIANPLAEIAARLLHDGLARVSGRPASDFRPVPAELQRYLGVEPEAVRAVRDATAFVLVSATWSPGWPPMHEWAARACAATLACAEKEKEQGVVVDTFVPRILSPQQCFPTLPVNDSQFRLSQWVVVFQSTSSTGTWLTTKGLGRFGLPELQVRNVPPQYGEPWTSLMYGIASRVLRLWLEALRARGDASFAEIPTLVEAGEADVARAHAAEPRGGGNTRLRLTFDPASQAGVDSFLTIQPLEDYGGSAGEYFAGMCADVFGRADHETRYVPTGTQEMDKAMATAGSQLPAVRRRFLEGEIPPRARLMVKHRIVATDGSQSSEYPWAYVTSWDDPAKVLGNSAGDAVLDPRVRVGRPIVISAESVVDWAIWIDGEGVVEGGLTNVVASEQGQPQPPEG
jgi:hypothetical protein